LKESAAAKTFIKEGERISFATTRRSSTHLFALVHDHEIFALLRRRPAEVSQDERDERDRRTACQCAAVIVDAHIGLVLPLIELLTPLISARQKDARRFILGACGYRSWHRLKSAHCWSAWAITAKLD
jgi:hypothetical protein